MRSTFLFTLFLLCFHFSNAGNRIESSQLNQSSPNFRARVYFSTEVPVNGVAKEGKEFTIDPTNGSYLYIVIDNYPTNFTSSQLKVKIYKTNSALQLVSFEDKNYDINTGYYYSYIKYSFYSAGTYTFDIFTARDEFIGSGTVVINASSSSSGTSNTSSSSDPYSKAKLYFSTETPSYGVAKDVKKFTIDRDGGYVYTVIDNYPTNFPSASLTVYIYKYDGSSYVKKDEKTYDINTSYYYTYFKYTFREAGDYKFVAYDGRDKYVATGYCTVNWE